MEQAAGPPTLHDKLEGLAALGAGLGPDHVLDFLVDVLTIRGWRLTEERRRVCAELIWKMTRLASGGGRRQAARRLATLDSAPSDLLMALAREPIDVAEPVLRYGRNLRGDHLLQVISEEGVEHLRALATRPELSEATTTLMLLRGDREALLACLGNRRARIARATFSALGTAAVTDAGLRGALAGRGDLPDTVVDTLWPHLDVELKSRLLAAGFAYGPDQLGEFRAETARRPAVPASDPTAAVLGLDEPPSLIEAAWILSAAAGIEEGLAFNLLRGAYERGVVLLARLAGLDERAFLRIACSAASLKVRTPNVNGALRAFAQATPEEARAVLGRIKV
ncbi:DUF2336 domain-containing protein [Salinarimonas soli]|nr:DUF2336 domain-containing protein [Salinarimonas soli]